MQQIPLNLYTESKASKSDLIKGEHNSEIVNFLFNNFLTSAEKIILICGPDKVGKSYLSQLYLDEVKGIKLNDSNISTLEQIEDLVTKNKVYLLEDISLLAKQTEKQLFNFYNLVAQSNSKLILTSRVSPKQIDFYLPDLHSRILNTRVFFISEPKDDVIKLVLFKMFQDRQLKVDMSIVNYILNRVVRKSLVFYNLINKVEQEIFTNKQKLTIALVKKLLPNSVS